MDNSRRIYNPIQKDYVTFLKTASETNGEYTLVEVELSSKGGVACTITKPIQKNLIAWKVNWKYKLEKKYIRFWKEIQ